MRLLPDRENNFTSHVRISVQAPITSLNVQTSNPINNSLLPLMKNLKSTNEAHESNTPAMTALQSFFPEFERNDFADCTAIVENLKKLPTLVSVAVTLSDLLDDSRTRHADEVIEVIRRDTAIHPQVLRAANLGYYSGMSKIDNLADAVCLLGFDKVRKLTIQVAFHSVLGMPRAKSFDWPEFWKHSLGVATAAETLAVRLGREDDAESFFTCGLLHDVGKVVSALSDVRGMNHALRVARESGCELIEAERRLEVPPHDLLGAALCERWGLPILLSDVIANHHEEDPFRRDLSSSGNEVFVDVVTLANFLVHRLGFGDSGHNAKTEPSEKLLARIGLSSTDLPELILEVDQNLKGENCPSNGIDGRN